MAPSGKAGVRSIRSRDAMTSVIPNISVPASSIYEQQGNSGAALMALGTVEESPTQTYNQSLLSYLQGQNDGFVNNLGESSKLESDRRDEGLPPRKRKQKEWILVYNRSLILYASGRTRDAASPLLEILRPMIIDEMALHPDVLHVITHMSFLILDCILTLSEGSHGGLEQIDDVVTAVATVDWIDSQDLDSYPQVKFLLSLYKSRLDFGERGKDGKLVDSNVRGVKKELKLAMEIFNHKLKATGEASSIGSHSDVYSENDNSNSREYTAPAAIGTQDSLLQAHHQSALNLKAHLEQLKGNTKKSLVLLQEAQTAHDDPIYEAIHANNLAIVYGTSGKRHLALHTAAKALRAPNGGLFRSDGTARSVHMFAMLHNSALCALQGRNYRSAYECLAACVQRSPVYFQRPRCWLRMAEACLGLHAEMKKKDSKNPKRKFFSVVEVEGKPRGIFLHEVPSADLRGDMDPKMVLGGHEDLEFVSKKPLMRAIACLEMSTKMLRDKTVPETLRNDKDCLESARCALAYIKLEMKEYKEALVITRLILIESMGYDGGGSGMNRQMHKRRLATASLYACEASVALGDAKGAMAFLAGGSADTDVIRLASELCGVTPDVAAKSVQGKSRLKRAQVVVGTSASAATASLGSLGAAKQCAMSAISLEEDRSLLPTDTYRASARQALLYCMLIEGNREGALAVLRSSS